MIRALKIFFFPVAQEPNWCLDLIIVEISRSHTSSAHRWDFFERGISSSQRLLPTLHSTNTRVERLCLQCDSNPQSGGSSGCRSGLWTARQPGLTHYRH